MDKSDFSKYNLYDHVFTGDFSMIDTPSFLSRTLSIVGESQINLLRNSKVAIAGLGGVGGSLFLTLVRFGLECFHLAEYDCFDISNINRQWGAFNSTLSKPKIDIYSKMAIEINSKCCLQTFSNGLVPNNAHSFLEGVDAFICVMDQDKGTETEDFVVDLCFSNDIPVFSAGAYGFGSIMINFHPNGIRPQELYSLIFNKSDEVDIFPSLLSQYFSNHFVVPFKKSLSSGHIGSTSIGASLAGTVLANEVIIYLLRNSSFSPREPLFAPYIYIFDLLTMNSKILDVSI